MNFFLLRVSRSTQQTRQSLSKHSSTQKFMRLSCSFSSLNARMNNTFNNPSLFDVQTSVLRQVVAKKGKLFAFHVSSSAGNFNIFIIHNFHSTEYFFIFKLASIWFNLNFHSRFHWKCCYFRVEIELKPKSSSFFFWGK